jgi:hypothetical protein
MTAYTEEGLTLPEDQDDSKEAKTDLKGDSKEIRKLPEDNRGEALEEPMLLRRRSEMEEKQKEAREGGKGKAGQQKKPVKDKDYYVYKLMGVVVHNGNAEAGHYYSYINVIRHEWEKQEHCLETQRDRWVEFNDSTVKEFTFSNLGADCYGGAQEEEYAADGEDAGEFAKLLAGRSKSAYLLIYERKQKLPVPVRLSDQSRLETDVVLRSLECDGTAISRAQPPSGRLLLQDGDDLYLLHSFYQTPIAIPTPIQVVR